MPRSDFTVNVLKRFLVTFPIRLRGLIVLPLLTRLYPQEICGAWIQILLIKEVLPPLLRLRTETALIRYLSLRDELGPERFIKAALAVTACLSVLFIMAMVLLKEKVSTLLFGNQDLSFLLVPASCWVAVHACMGVGLAVLRSQERIGTLSVRELISSLWLVGAVVAAFIINWDVRTLILLCVIGDAALMVWVFFQLGIGFPLAWSSKGILILRRFLSYSAPLILNSLFQCFSGAMDKLFIVHFLGLSFVGVYGVSLQASTAVTVLLSPIPFVLFPKAANSWNQGQGDLVNYYFSKAMTFTLLLSAPFIVGVYSVSDGLMTHFAGKDYVTSKGLILLLLLSGLGNAVFQNQLYVIHLREKTHFLSGLFLVTTFCNYLLSYFLIQRMGILGAAVSRLTVSSMMAFAISLYACRHIRLTIPWRILMKVTLISILMGLAISWVPTNTPEQLFITVGMGATVFVLLLFLSRLITVNKLVMLKKQWG